MSQLAAVKAPAANKEDRKKLAAEKRKFRAIKRS
jgi:hypothetical protein